MEPDVYIRERLEGQRKWYAQKSAINKRYHNGFNVLTIIFSVLIPLAAAMEELLLSEVSIAVVTGILGALVAILTAVSAFMKFKEKWINYRWASESLKSEKLLWETKTPPYDRADSFHLLVKRTEAIIHTENKDWRDYISEERALAKDKAI